MGRQASTQAGQDGDLQELPALPARPRPFRAKPPEHALAALPPATPGPHRDTPGTYARADLGPEPAAAAQARRLTRDTLARWDMRDLTEDAEAIASELAANAIRAATPSRGTLPAIIFAIHHRPGEVRIIVWDNGPGRPARTDAGPDDEAGRGLGIIDSLTGCNWGWWPTPSSGGKVVWAAVPTPAGAPAYAEAHPGHGEARGEDR